MTEIIIGILVIIVLIVIAKHVKKTKNDEINVEATILPDPPKPPKGEPF
jgi:hypothetical protein